MNLKSGWKKKRKMLKRPNGYFKKFGSIPKIQLRRLKEI